MLDAARYETAGGLVVDRAATDVPFETALNDLPGELDTIPGGLFSSSYEYPGRYKRWSMGFSKPPVEISAKGRDFAVRALNDRGRILLVAIAGALQNHPHLTALKASPDLLTGSVAMAKGPFDESERSRQPSVFSVVRAVRDLFGSDQDGNLGLYGAFGYDLIFQFEPIANMRPRPADQRDLVLYLPDELTVVDNQMQRAVRLTYDFEIAGKSTKGLSRDVAPVRLAIPTNDAKPHRDFEPGGYADIVRSVMPSFARGELFEVVPGQCLYEPTAAPPSRLFETMRRINPSPYGFLLNLGGEHLIGTSPEMFVRVSEGRVETCPISGTIRRGKDALEDADRIRELLNSAKDEAELTMCTDVDRNDKSRVCIPGSVQVIGRRQIELYSHLIHTVDHVEGRLRPGFDALDAFLSHTWAVTVTGAPKRAAIGKIEEVEKSSRRWYGGAVGCFSFDGSLNTGLTLRTIRLADGIAEIRVGATLLADSIPEDEEAETLVKAGAALRSLELAAQAAKPVSAPAILSRTPSKGPRTLLVDCEDSFVHTLGSYLAAAGAELSVFRHDVAEAALAERPWDLLVLSPGPGRPADFGVPDRVRQGMALGLPIFGVCLGLQGIVEAFGGTLGQMVEPQHGKSAAIDVVGDGSVLFAGLPQRFTVGRYHSLHAATLPAELAVTARTVDGIVMAVEHRSAPVRAVQFHPESIMSLAGGVGSSIIRAVVDEAMRHAGAKGQAA